VKQVALVALACSFAFAQEATTGIEVHGTISVQGAYSHQLSAMPGEGPLAGSLRGLFYSTLKLDSHWSFSTAIDISSRPYFYRSFGLESGGAEVNLRRANLSYSRIGENKSMVVKVGQMPSAFGAFLLRYDDAVNPLIDVPLSSTYYGGGVASEGMAGAQVDATYGKLDGRVQFMNSSPGNPRSLMQSDQYGSWTGGLGYTISQGFRVGASSYRGPYLDRKWIYYFPGEAKPKDLPGTAVGVEAQWGRGPWNAFGEWQRFVFAYQLIPYFIQETSYAELRRTLNPRWYVAGRVGYLRSSATPTVRVYETAVGFRPNRRQLIKLGYEVMEGPAVRGTLGNTFAIQLVTQLPSVSHAWK